MERKDVRAKCNGHRADDVGRRAGADSKGRERGRRTGRGRRSGGECKAVCRLETLNVVEQIDVVFALGIRKSF